MDAKLRMGKLVVLKLGPGSFQQGFSVVLQLGWEGERPALELPGELPPAPDLPGLYQQWQAAYRQMRVPSRLEAQAQVTNVSWVSDCRESADMLCDRINHWLAQPSFQPIYSKLLEQLSPTETIRVVLQTQDPILQRLPWHQWDFFQRYPQAELALSAPVYEQVKAPETLSKTVRILAIFGDATGVDLETDRRLLQTLPGVELHLLTTPDRATLNHYLWEQQGWDILFFAGHSSSAGATGRMRLNAQDSLSLSELKYALTKAVKRGLAIAIFNSCDGLGLAQELADLHIPQILVMREPVPDRVAHEFLKGFLESFSRYTPLYLSVREARERLQGLENEFPCATWLPILCQNLAQQPPSWQSLQGRSLQATPKHQPWVGGALGVAIAATTLGLRLLGGLQSLELATYDRFLRWWPFFESPDSRIVVIKNTEDDIKQQGLDKTSAFSMTDDTLLAVLKKLEPLQPKVIGFDIYHDREIDSDLPELRERLETTPHFVALCKHPSDSAEMGGVAAIPDVDFSNRLGFSDFIDDTDSTARRFLVAIHRPPDSLCHTNHSFAAIIAGQYLNLIEANDSLTDVFWQNDQDQFQLAQVKFPQLNPRSGGYKLNDFGGYQLLLHYRHLPQVEDIAETYTVSELLRGDFEGEKIRDRIILIGTTALSFGGGDIEERDFWKTPYTTSERLEDMTPGVFIQAHIVSQLISAVEDGRPSITTWNEWIESGWIILWAAIGGGLGWYLTDTRFWLTLLSAEVGLLLISWSLLAVPALWVPYVPAVVTFTATAIAVSRYRYK
ncbi:CHASE2 domain-containing protein [Leptolyngbya ectocarpi]|nr:CHASE2 domain-containing protein [Leptolyngbya ectocarpi]